MATAVAYTHTFATPITQQQKDLAIYFEQLLVKIARIAGVSLGTLSVGDAGKFGLKLEERFNSMNPKAHAFYRASAGSSIERIVYSYLLHNFAKLTVVVRGGETAGIYSAEIGTLDDIVPIVFAIEYTGSYAPDLPSSFKKSRPDIRLGLGAGSDGKHYEALYDLTSVGGIGHILKKGDSWVTKHSVAFVSEIIWTNDDIMQR